MISSSPSSSCNLSSGISGRHFEHAMKFYDRLRACFPTRFCSLDHRTTFLDYLFLFPSNTTAQNNPPWVYLTDETLPQSSPSCMLLTHFTTAHTNSSDILCILFASAVSQKPLRVPFKTSLPNDS